MALPYSSQLTQIPSGTAVSSPFHLRNLNHAYVHVPSYAAVTAWIQGSTDTTSANFRRLANTAVASTGAFYSFTTIANGVVADISHAVGLPQLRIEISSNATITLSLDVTGIA